MGGASGHRSSEPFLFFFFFFSHQATGNGCCRHGNRKEAGELGFHPRLCLRSISGYRVTCDFVNSQVLCVDWAGTVFVSFLSELSHAAAELIWTGKWGGWSGTQSWFALVSQEQGVAVTVLIMNLKTIIPSKFFFSQLLLMTLTMAPLYSVSQCRETETEAAEGLMTSDRAQIWEILKSSIPPNALLTTRVLKF